MGDPTDIPDAPRFDLVGRTALVTGAARGIGRGCAIALAQAGADVALGFRDADRPGKEGGVILQLSALPSP